jgi:UDP-N-acetylglucosamine 2-epimerase (non-hydrolysing)
MKKKILFVVGARPNFMKVAPVMKEMSKRPAEFAQLLVHTGQHYDEEMSGSFFNSLDLVVPDIYLGVGSGTHAVQTGRVLIEFERVCTEHKPDLIIVVGDVNSTVACALVAAKLGIPVAHIEAGLRSFDRTMPEEINRILTDQIADYLFTTCGDGNQNLKKEGIPKEKIFFVGNVMIDTLLSHLERARNSNILEKLGLRRNNRIRRYVLVTLHRPSNVDDQEILKGILKSLNQLAKKVPVIFPAHPRTIKMMRHFELLGMVKYRDSILSGRIDQASREVLVIPPLGYIDFLCLMSRAAVVFTDSGGIQEETTILGIPCLTLRNNTERPITVKEGTNILVGNDPDKIVKTAREVLKSGTPRKKVPRLWDGKAAKRIVKILRTVLS